MREFHSPIVSFWSVSLVSVDWSSAIWKKAVKVRFGSAWVCLLVSPVVRAWDGRSPCLNRWGPDCPFLIRPKGDPLRLRSCPCFPGCCGGGSILAFRLFALTASRVCYKTSFIIKYVLQKIKRWQINRYSFNAIFSPNFQHTLNSFPNCKINTFSPLLHCILTLFLSVITWKSYCFFHLVSPGWRIVIHSSQKRSAKTLRLTN